MRRVVPTVIALLIGACADGGGIGVTTSTGAVIPSSSAPTSTLPPVVECPGDGEFEEGGSLAEIDEDGSDSHTIGRISWEASDQCETFTFEFETEEGAPATTVPDLHIEHLNSFQVIRITMDVESTVVTDQLVETGLVHRLYVVRALEGGMFVDLHLAAPAAARAGIRSSPARLTVDLRPGFVPFDGSASIGEFVVLMNPAADHEVGQVVQVAGYSRTFESNVLIVATQGDFPVVETSTTAADYIETWGEFRTEVTLPPGAVSLFVGESSPEDGSLEGVTVELLVS